MHSLCLASVNFTVVFWVVAALHWKMSHHLFCSYLREMIPRAGSPVVKSVLPKETNSVTQMGLDLEAATQIPGWGSSDSSWKLPKWTLKQEQETLAVGERCHFWRRGWVGLQGTKQRAQLRDTPVPWDQSPHGSPQLPSGGRDGSAAGGKIPTTDFILLLSSPDREGVPQPGLFSTCSRTTKLGFKESWHISQASGLPKSLPQFSALRISPISPSNLLQEVSVTLNGIFPCAISGCTVSPMEMFLSHSRGIPESARTKPQIQGHGAGRVYRQQQRQDGKITLEERQGLKGVTCKNISQQAAGRNKEEGKKRRDWDLLTAQSRREKSVQRHQETRGEKRILSRKWQIL